MKGTDNREGYAILAILRREGETKRRLWYVETGLKITRQNKKFKGRFSKRP